MPSNPAIAQLLPYPFERLTALKQAITPPTSLAHIALSLGEPKHPAPDFVIEALGDPALLRASLGTYPATRGSDALRDAMAQWLSRRFAVSVSAQTQVLPVAGTREGLFAIAQALLSGRAGARVIVPNPFYQIYEGAALMRGAKPLYLPCDADNQFLPDFGSVPEPLWRDVELVYLCTPGNPTGAVSSLAALQELLTLADRHDFIVVSDECYSEIYADEQTPPAGLLTAAAQMGNPEFRRALVFNSLSKRSNLPGLRSGLIAGDAQLLAQFLKYRTYHGCALPSHTQQVSTLAWQDETHVVENRRAYRAKFDAIEPILAPHFTITAPAGSFFSWLPVRAPAAQESGSVELSADAAFAAQLFREQHVTVLPGSFLGRDVQPELALRGRCSGQSPRQGPGTNPGNGYVRVAWVAPLSECVDGARRLAAFAAAH